jgi:ADP-ribose pyrophosphatase
LSGDEPERPQIMWEGRYVRAIKQGRWEYVGRVNEVRAVVILAEFDGKMILIDQPRAAVGGQCLELPAGLVGDLARNATVEDTAVKELEEETGFTAERVERLGDFHSSPGMLSESFTLVRAHGVRRCGEGGGVHGEEDINVHLVARADIPAFVAQKRTEGVAIDVKLMLFLNF